MSYQYLYSDIPVSQNYAQDLRLIQYNVVVNPLDPLGLQGNQYIITDPSQYVNKSYNIQNTNQVYTKQIAFNQKMNTYQSQNESHTIHFHQKNNLSQPNIHINQNIPQQIYFKNNILTLQNQQKIKPKIPSQLNQNMNSIIPKKPQNQRKSLVNPKQQIQQQPQFPKNFQAQIKPLVQPSHQNKEVQFQPNGCTAAEIQYQKYIQRYPFQNQNKKINIEYNKNDEHFVNKPIYPERKHSSCNSKAKLSQENQKQIKALHQKEILDKGIKIEVTNNNPNLPRDQGGLLNNTKIKNQKLSIEEEKEIDIKQIEASNIISQISNKFNEEKESPIEEKTPEPTFPELMGVHNQNIIIQKSISQSGISDYDANLSHLPTINSILRGNSDLLPL